MTHYTGAVPATQRPTDWRVQGACAGLDPERWFPKPGNTIAVRAAKSICHGCPSMLQCASHALTRGETDGVWGGLSEGQRTTIRKKYKIHQLENPARLEAAVYEALHFELNPTETLRNLWDENTYSLPDGHLGWRGASTSFSFHGIPITPKQLSFLLDRGHKATGIVRRTPECPVVECIHPRHLLDNRERHQRVEAAKESAARAAAQAQYAAEHLAS
ncbi:WhiB family transcriptional regulator [Streptomyces misionensis]|uniref:WhiB family transcriptional regulator n=1 Tax=Streptomyces misionensis TaxID=67331 RepID=UPI00368AF6CE